METCIGYVTHYYNRIGVAVLSLERPLRLNDILHIFGHSSDFFQKVWSMEVNHRKVDAVGAGAPVALEVAERVHAGDRVFLVTEMTPGETQELLFEQLREWET